jgi:Domain of unknown function (DUF1707)
MCGHRHYHDHRQIERRVERDPTLRVSDRERDEATTLLRDHAAEGRLSPEELDERVERALAAQTGADLDAVLADLPRKRSVAERRDGVRGLTGLVTLAVLLVSIWLVTGAGYFWPVWILGFMAFSLFRRGRLRGPHWT